LEENYTLLIKHFPNSIKLANAFMVLQDEKLSHKYKGFSIEYAKYADYLIDTLCVLDKNNLATAENIKALIQYRECLAGIYINVLNNLNIKNSQNFNQHQFDRIIAQISVREKRLRDMLPNFPDVVQNTLSGYCGITTELSNKQRYKVAKAMVIEPALDKLNEEELSAYAACVTDDPKHASVTAQVMASLSIQDKKTLIQHPELSYTFSQAVVLLHRQQLCDVENMSALVDCRKFLDEIVVKLPTCTDQATFDEMIEKTQALKVMKCKNKETSFGRLFTVQPKILDNILNFVSKSSPLKNKV